MDLKEAIFLKKMLCLLSPYEELEGLTKLQTTSNKQVWLRSVTILCAFKKKKSAKLPNGEQQSIITPVNEAQNSQTPSPPYPPCQDCWGTLLK